MLYYLYLKYNENQVGVKGCWILFEGKSLMAEQKAEAVGADVALWINSDFSEIWVILIPDTPKIYCFIYMEFW